MKTELTDEQVKAVYAVEAELKKAHRDAEQRLAAAGFSNDPDVSPFFSCRLSDGCQQFTFRPRRRECATPGCGHSLLVHRLPQ